LGEPRPRSRPAQTDPSRGTLGLNTRGWSLPRRRAAEEPTASITPLRSTRKVPAAQKKGLMSGRRSPCSSCWARGPGADLPAGQDPEYRPGSDTAAHTCPADRPFVAGGADTCGCMAPYHNKVCDESRCCKSEYQCYGNCGDYTGLYIFLGVLGGLIFLCAVATSFRKRRKEQVRCLPYTFSCAFPKLLCEKFVENFSLSFVGFVPRRHSKHPSTLHLRSTSRAMRSTKRAR
jgi:hypothetical protein